jgi:hypothetical protein
LNAIVGKDTSQGLDSSQPLALRFESDVVRSDHIEWASTDGLLGRPKLSISGLSEYGTIYPSISFLGGKNRTAIHTAFNESRYLLLSITGIHSFPKTLVVEDRGDICTRIGNARFHVPNEEEFKRLKQSRYRQSLRLM